MSPRKDYKLASVGRILRLYRQNTGLSQERFGDLLNVPGQYVSQLELGKSYPSLRMVIRWARAAGVEPGKILDEIATIEKI